MHRQPVFQRSPRLRPELPAGEMEIPAPPPAPSEPGMSLLSVLMALVPGLLGAVVMYFFVRTSGTGSMAYLAYSLPMMAAGYLVQVGHLYLQKRKYLRDVTDREQRYRALLEARRQELAAFRERQQTALRATDPAPELCLERATTLASSLWERSPGEDDFLRLRLGVGRTALGVTVKVPRPPNALDEDPLYKEAGSLAAEFAAVENVPVHLPLSDCGVAGLAGQREAVLHAARSLAVQVAAHHSPDEVRLAALFAAEEAPDWAWMRWLPHVWTEGRRRRWLAAGADGGGRLLGDLQEFLQARRLQAAMPGKKVPLPAVVVFIAASRLVENHPALPLLLREGAALGVFPVLLAERKEELPMECRVLAECARAGGGAHLMDARTPGAPEPFTPDEAPADLAEHLARALAPIRLSQMAAPAAIPSRVTLLETLGLTRLDELDVATRWRESQPDRSLAVPLGARAGSEPLVLDLHERGHGPHGLVAGATGSGKSELLQTLIAALAATYHPHEVAFVLVDYKGGGMAGAFQELPHLTGTITNLEGGLAGRALAALKSELKRRQRLLGAAGLNHIDDYIRQRRLGHVLEPLPHLILVVDEFAELKAEQPDFMRELISAVRVGRSLGVHLILATQKPAGVVDEQIWSNTRFRICLRVERPEDSQEVLRRPEAAALIAAGRAYLQVGNHERFELFQAGWGGAPYDPNGEAAPDRNAPMEVALDGTRHALATEPPRRADAATGQLKALLAHICETAAREGVAPLPGPWLPPLPATLLLQDVQGAGGWNGQTWELTATWMEPVAGLADDPENQEQRPLRLPLAAQGHLAVFGSPGSGKSSLLQTMVTSLALAHSPGDLHIYIADGSGRSLSGLADLPHVGAVVAVDEEERVRRLMRHLLQEADCRKRRMGAMGVGNLAEYRRAGGVDLPGLLVVLDNCPALTAAHPDAEEAVAQLARDGGALGIHLILSAGSPSLLRHRIASNVTLAVALHLADRSEYSVAVGRTGGLEPASLPGRGLVRGTPPLEFQTALPAGGETEWERTGSLRLLFKAMDRAWSGLRPEPVRILPELLHLSVLPPPTIGLEVETLEPFVPDLRDGPHFVICGPAASGKSNLLRAWTLTLAAHVPLRLWLADPGGTQGPLRNLPQVEGYAAYGPEFEVLADSLAEGLKVRHEGPEAALVLVIDDFDLFRTSASDSVKERLEQMVRRQRGAGLHILAAGSAGVFGQYGYEGLVKALTEMQTGFVLGSSEHTDLQVLGLRLPAGEAGRRLPSGQGYYARRGRSVPVKTALVDEQSMKAWAERVGHKEGVGS